MPQPHLSVREIAEADIDAIINYWHNSDDTFLAGMGVDLAKIPAKEDMRMMLRSQLTQGYNEKQSYCIIWLEAGKAIGHSNINKIIFGEEAFMHLHIWDKAERKKGTGTVLIQLSLPYFFENLSLKKLYCEPYALNPAPNKTLKKAGFSFVKEYITIPGYLNFEQPVNLWEMRYEDYKNNCR